MVVTHLRVRTEPGLQAVWQIATGTKPESAIAVKSLNASAEKPHGRVIVLAAHVRPCYPISSHPDDATRRPAGKAFGGAWCSFSARTRTGSTPRGVFRSLRPSAPHSAGVTKPMERIS